MIIDMDGIFYETQRGGLCRLHSLNAFFGEAKISDGEFRKYSDEMDTYVKNKYRGDSHCLNFDSVSPDHNILVTFILKKFGYYSRYLHLNAVRSGRVGTLKDNLKDLAGDFFFVFNSDHIWGVRRKCSGLGVETWYNVDSLSGVRHLNVDSLEKTLNIGFIIPVDRKAEFYENVIKIRNVITQGRHMDAGLLRESVEVYITNLNIKQLILGDLEVPINIAMDILDTKLEFDMAQQVFRASDQEFGPIQRLVDQYKEFLKEFVPSRYHDLDLKLKYLMRVILVLLNLIKK